MTEAERHRRVGDPADAPAPKDVRRDLILKSAERLFAERGFRNVSVRDVAADVGVTHPLIYYYWSSKDALLAEVVGRSQARVRAMAHGEAAETVTAIVRETLTENRLYLLTLTRALIDGMPPSEWPGGFPGVEAAIELLERDAPDDAYRDTVRERVAITTALLEGWALIEDQLLEIVGLSRGDRGHARETMLAAVRHVLDPSTRLT
jgi:AcrR family transcriptional regulator